MDWEAPADAWYVWVAVSVLSVAIAGVAFGLPSGPPPDANDAANSIESVTGSPYQASSTVETDAETITIDGKTIELTNEHGTAHASLAYGVVVPVNDHDRLERLVYGTTFEQEYEDELADGDTHALDVFLSDVEAAYEENSGTEFTADGEIQTREVSVDSGVDAIDPLHETVTLDHETTEYSIGVPWDYVTVTGVRTVEVTYEGIEGTEVEFEVTGEYTGTESSEFDENASGTYDGSGELVLEEEIKAGDENFWGTKRPGQDPVSYSLSADNPIEHDNGISRHGAFNIGDDVSFENTIDRSADFDDDRPFVDLKRTTGNYHVTLVIV